MNGKRVGKGSGREIKRKGMEPAGDPILVPFPLFLIVIVIVSPVFII